MRNSTQKEIDEFSGGAAPEVHPHEGNQGRPDLTELTDAELSQVGGGAGPANRGYGQGTADGTPVSQPELYPGGPGQLPVQEIAGPHAGTDYRLGNGVSTADGARARS